MNKVVTALHDLEHLHATKIQQHQPLLPMLTLVPTLQSVSTSTIRQQLSSRSKVFELYIPLCIHVTVYIMTMINNSKQI
jgi:hypothetical protein